VEEEQKNFKTNLWSGFVFAFFLSIMVSDLVFFGSIEVLTQSLRLVREVLYASCPFYLIF
jgi:hypothetical protein